MSKNIIICQKDRKKLLCLALLLLVGILLLGISKCASSDSDDEASSAELENLDPSAYAEEVEQKVESLCNKIDGVSSAHVVVTLKGGYRAIYATDHQSGSSSNKKQTVIIGSGSSEHALLVGYENPEIAGIGIVCSGGDDAQKRKLIISVVSSAFDISTNKIFVTGS